MRYADWLRFRADLFVIACFFFIWKEAYPLAFLCGVICFMRHWQAMRMAAKGLVFEKNQQPEKRKLSNGN